MSMEEFKKSVEIDYKSEYYRLKNIETENQQLKETIIEMSKYVFKRDNSLVCVIENIDKRLEYLNKEIQSIKEKIENE